MPGTKLLASFVAVAALAFVPAVAMGSVSRATSGSTTYQDSAGEDPQGPDITSTTVSNDDTGLITFHVAISNRPALTPDMLVELDFDTDNSSSTGDSKQVVPGTDYIIQLVTGTVNLYKWSGSDFPATTAPSLTYAYDATGATIRINAADLGNTRTLNFAGLAVSGLTTDANGDLNLANAHADLTPDSGHGTFTYQVRITVSLKATAFTTSPKTVRAGGSFSVGLAATESDTGGPVAEGTVTCTARVGDTALRVKSKRLVNGVAVCVWVAPRTAKGKRVTGSVTLTAKGATLSKSFAVRVSL
jgi:hypothetical protein